MRAALAFLTRIPVGPPGRGGSDGSFGDLGRQAPLFPLVGLLVGGVTLAVDYGAGLLFGPAVRSALDLAAMVWLTGALHLDGLMDTADGLGANRSPERSLEIMRDSRVGAMGAVAGALDLLLRFAFLLEVAGGLRARALLLAPALGRMTMALAAGIFPPARNAGLGTRFASHVGRWQVAGALAVGLLAAIAAGGLRGTLAALLASGVAVVTGRALAARLGGLTGDTYGAVNELAEITVLAVFATQTGHSF